MLVNKQNYICEDDRGKLRLGIDASNLRNGGTVTHLIELLRFADPLKYNFEAVWVWAGSAVLSKLEDRTWLNKSPQPLLEQSKDPFRDRRHLLRAYWQRYKLSGLARAAGCHVLFVPGGMDNSGFNPMVTMSRNMLVFDSMEAKRYSISPSRFRLVLLRWLQTRTFQRATGVILLTQYAKKVVSAAVGIEEEKKIVIPHGIGQQFSLRPRSQCTITEKSDKQPFRILYVSTIDLYKHQWHVATAVSLLRAHGLPVVLDLIGPASRSALAILTKTLNNISNSADYINYHGAVPFNELPHFYAQADLKVFASSCENMPNILLEAMAAGLPIACSLRGPMPEVLGDGGVYFDPEKPAEIAEAIRQLIESPDLRREKAEIAYERAQNYSWKRCADETFAFLAECACRNSETVGDTLYGRS